MTTFPAIVPTPADVIVEHVGSMGDIRIRPLDGRPVDFRCNETAAFERAEELVTVTGGRVIEGGR